MMIDILKTVDNWFLLLISAALGLWFVWSLKRIFSDLKGSIERLDKTIEKLFAADKDFENRLSTLEGEHKALSCQIKGMHT